MTEMLAVLFIGIIVGGIAGAVMAFRYMEDTHEHR